MDKDDKPSVLPRANNVVIPEGKIHYSMRKDENKSILWQSILGFTYEKDAPFVRKQIEEGVLKYGCIQSKTDKYGNHYYVVVLMISHNNTKHRVLTTWIDDIEAKETRLTTLYPLTDKEKKEVIIL